MLREPPAAQRELRTERIEADLVVVGGGLAGLCCSVTAARAGIRVALVHDRPVLGGNASSEVRMLVLGATASMGNNNRWAREGGVVDEFLLENLYRNPEGNALVSDTILLEMAICEPNLRLLLNTAAFEVEKVDAETIRSVRAFCSQNSTLYELHAPSFCDASGDGILGFLAGAAFRMGAESRDEFDEPLAPDEAYGELLGHTLYFYSKDAGRPVKFVPPSFALADITEIARWQRITPADQGCQYWWLEYGGRFDTVHDTEAVKWRLWEIVYGIWDHIKNSGRFSEAETLTLEWVGTVPGKRESRRFEGLAMLTQHDVVRRRPHDDAVSYGGWSLDLHPADGVYSQRPPCNQWHSKGIYPIPYRCMVSRNVGNLFLTGRLISVSHVAFGSTRVMATCAHNGQAVGMAAAVCRRRGLRPADLAQGEPLAELRLELARAGQFIPGYRLDDPDDLTRLATITASSRLNLAELPADGGTVDLSSSRAMLLPLSAGPVPAITLWADVAEATEVQLELRRSAEAGCFTPDATLARASVRLGPGENQAVRAEFDAALDAPGYVFVCVLANELVALRTSSAVVSGLTPLVHRGIAEVTAAASQDWAEELGVDNFEFWRPLRPPEGRNLAVQIDPPLDVFPPEAVRSGVARPTCGPNAWVAAFDDPQPTLVLRWPEPQIIGRVELTFDTDRDNPLFSVLLGHPDRFVRQCVREYRLIDSAGRVLARCAANHQTRNTVCLNPALTTEELRVELAAPGPLVPAAVVEVRCYG